MLPYIDIENPSSLYKSCIIIYGHGVRGRVGSGLQIYPASGTSGSQPRQSDS